MRKAISAVLALIMSGCVTKPPQLPDPRAPTGTGSTDWGVVAALQRGEWVFVTLDGGETLRGTIVSVTGTTVTVWDYDGQQVLPRDTVERLVQRVQIGTKRAPRWVYGATLAGLLGGFVGVFANYKNDALHLISAFALMGAMFTADELKKTDVPRPIFEDRLLYVRP